MTFIACRNGCQTSCDHDQRDVPDKPEMPNTTRVTLTEYVLKSVSDAEKQELVDALQDCLSILRDESQYFKKRPDFIISKCEAELAKHKVTK